MELRLRQQRSIATSVRLEGFGFWSGQDVRVEFHPAPPDTGLVFVRTDLDEPVRIPATVAHRVETPRRTTLAAGDTSVEMVEHVLAACAGLRIDNCEIHVDRQEIPGADGSSLPFTRVLEQAGFVEQPRPRRQLVVAEVTRVGSDASWVEARPAAQGGFSLEYRMDYGPGPIGRQTLRLDVGPATFSRELAAARTFLPREEAEWLRGRGLGKRVTYQDVLVFGDHGPLDNELRFHDECVRHKALDLVGDLALAGCDIVGQVTAYRSGHRLNAELVRRLLSDQAEREHRRQTA